MQPDFDLRNFQVVDFGGDRAARDNADAPHLLEDSRDAESIAS